MAEAIALGASIVAIIQIADRIAGICRFYIQSTRNAPSEFRTLLLELSALKAIFENVRFLAEENNNSSNIIKTFSDQHGPIAGCNKSIMELEQLLDIDSDIFSEDSTSKKRKRQAIVAALQWPLKENRVKRLMEEISRFKSTITLALTTESM